MEDCFNPAKLAVTSENQGPRFTTKSPPIFALRNHAHRALSENGGTEGGCAGEDSAQPRSATGASAPSGVAVSWQDTARSEGVALRHMALNSCLPKGQFQ